MTYTLTMSARDRYGEPYSETTFWDTPEAARDYMMNHEDRIVWFSVRDGVFETVDLD